MFAVQGRPVRLRYWMPELFFALHRNDNRSSKSPVLPSFQIRNVFGPTTLSGVLSQLPYLRAPGAPPCPEGSTCDGSGVCLDVDAAVRRGHELMQDGADLLVPSTQPLEIAWTAPAGAGAAVSGGQTAEPAAEGRLIRHFIYLDFDKLRSLSSQTSFG